MKGGKIMATIDNKLKENIQSLSDVEKLELVDSILMALDRPDPEIDRIWAEEARKRWEAYKSGKLETVSYDEVMNKYRDK
jgi:putative addiction module component (TIGR02574 family)